MITVSSNVINDIFRQTIKTLQCERPRLNTYLKVGPWQSKITQHWWCRPLSKSERASEQRREAAFRRRLQANLKLLSFCLLTKRWWKKNLLVTSSGTEFAVLEQFHEDSEEFREDSGSIGCQLNWVAFRWQRMLNWPRYGSNLPARGVQQKFIYRAERSKNLKKLLQSWAK